MIPVTIEVTYSVRRSSRVKWSRDVKERPATRSRDVRTIRHRCSLRIRKPRNVNVGRVELSDGVGSEWRRDIINRKFYR